MITIYCLVALAGNTKTQKVPFYFSPAEASNYLSRYGVHVTDEVKLTKLACENLEETLDFFDEVD